MRDLERASGRPASPPSRPAAPDADSESALARLLDVVLDKGVYLDLELVITVARVPLIAVNLRATIAGVETMLEWGVPGIWSEAAATGEGLEASAGRVAHPPVERTPDRAAAAAEFPAAMREPRAGSSVWRDGTLVLQGDGGIQWRGSGDRRPTLVLDRGDLDGVRIEQDATAADPVLVLEVGGRVERLASPRADDIRAALAPEPDRSTMDGEKVP